MLDLGDVSPQAALAAEIVTLRRDLNELKGRQLTGGDDIVMQLTETGNTWDVDQTVSGAYGIVWWEVLFTPDHAVSPYAEFGFDWQVTPDSGFEYFSTYPSPNHIAGSGVAFIVEYSNPNFTDVNVKLRFSVKSVDTGSLSWTVVRQEAA